jgi:branched-subunit amino acid transport protein
MTWLAVLIVGTISLLFRVSMLSRSTSTVSPLMDRSLSAMGPAVITSLITAEIVDESRTGNNAVYIAACVVAMAITRRTGNLLYGTGGAMAIVWIFLLIST